MSSDPGRSQVSSAGTAVVSMNAFSAFRLAGGWWCRTNNALLLMAGVALI